MLHLSHLHVTPEHVACLPEHEQINNEVREVKIEEAYLEGGLKGAFGVGVGLQSKLCIAEVE